jgi:hypothetical protein
MILLWFLPSEINIQLQNSMSPEHLAYILPKEINDGHKSLFLLIKHYFILSGFVYYIMSVVSDFKNLSYEKQNFN